MMIGTDKIFQGYGNGQNVVETDKKLSGTDKMEWGRTNRVGTDRNSGDGQSFWDRNGDIRTYTLNLVSFLHTKTQNIIPFDPVKPRIQGGTH